MTGPGAATAADAPALAAIHAAAFPQGWGAADIAALLQSPGCYARWVPGQAFILVRAVLDEAEIITLATVPARRRQGLAQALVGQAAALCLAQGVTVLHLEVAAGNLPAQALYAGLGFVRVGHRPGYYPDGSDAWLLRLNLCAAAAVHPPG